MMWIQKDRFDNYSVYIVLRSGRKRLIRVNELDKTAYKVFLEYLKQMSFSSRLPFYYYFPTYSPIPEARICIVKRKENDYQVALNLGSYLLSEMDQNQFDYLIGKLEGLASDESPIGETVYFEPVKDIFKND